MSDGVRYILHGHCYDYVDDNLVMGQHLTEHDDLEDAKAEARRLLSLKSATNPDFKPAMSARLWIESTDNSVFMRHDLFMGCRFNLLPAPMQPSEEAP